VLSANQSSTTNAALAEALTAERERCAALQKKLDEALLAQKQLRAAYEALRLELELVKHRMYVAKAERVDTTQLELQFNELLAKLDEAGAKLAANGGLPLPPPPDRGGKKERPKPKGRRDLRLLDLEEVRVEIPDPAKEALVVAGELRRIGFEESYALWWQRGGKRRLVKARVKYAPISRSDDDGMSGSESKEPAVRDPRSPDISFSPTGEKIFTAAMPTMTFPRCLAMPSLLAHIAIEKYCDGLPLFRIEERFKRDGTPVDRGTMSRWMEDMGATLGSTVVAAMRKHAMAHAFCIATDATGVAVQAPRTLTNMKRKPCAKGHFLIQIADADHVFFEYLVKETSIGIDNLFPGFSGYVQADAKSVFDLLYLSPDERRKRRPPPDDDDEAADNGVRVEVGCWSHARRKFWEAAVAKSEIGREGLARIGKIFALESRWRGKEPDEIRALRQQYAKPHVDDFFRWAAETYERVRKERGYERSAVGYAVRQQTPLARYLDDGRLVMDNNRSERGLRKVAVGRKAWMFFGSDDHAEAAGNLFALIASCRLHDVDPEAYLRDVLCVLAQWPKDRFLELAPLYWKQTRARLVDRELADEVAWFTIPPPMHDGAAEQQAAAE
jgi:transposase